MKKFALFNSEGFPTAFYGEDVHGSRTIPVYGEFPEPTEENPAPEASIIGYKNNPDCLIPNDAVEITDDQWQEFINNAGYRRWNGEKVIEYSPPEPTPEEMREVMPQLSARQLRLGLNSLGKLAVVEAAINQLPDPAKSEAKIEWEFAGTFRRDHPLILQISPILGLSDEQIDTVWLEYSTV